MHSARTFILRPPEIPAGHCRSAKHHCPPEILFHGTATKVLDAIWKEGLKPGNRRQVHLSATVTTAIKVGQRHGKPHVIEVQASRMHAEGFKFFQADNGVWLTDNVPPEFLADVK